MSRARDSTDIIPNGQQATAWCTFDGTLAGTNAPLAGYNIASITRISAGVYTINFITPMDILNYVISADAVLQASVVGSLAFLNTDTKSLTNFGVYTSNSTGSPADNSIVSVLTFGGKN